MFFSFFGADSHVFLLYSALFSTQFLVVMYPYCLGFFLCGCGGGGGAHILVKNSYVIAPVEMQILVYTIHF